MGLILAAGKGSRMLPFGDKFPKPLLPVCNRPLIQYQIDVLNACGIQDIVVVVGHLGEMLEAFPLVTAAGSRLRFVRQTEQLGIAHAVRTAAPLLDRPFFLLLGDIYFETRDLLPMFRLFEQERLDALLLTKNDEPPEAIRKNFAVVEGPDGLVTKVLEKAVHPGSSLKGCGLYLFAPRIFDAISATPRSALRNEFELTDSIQKLVEQGGRVKQLPWVTFDINVTSPADLLLCNLLLLRRLGGGNLASGNSVLREGAVAEDSVIGSGVEIEGPIALRRCVVLDGTRLSEVDARLIEDQIVGPS